MRRTFKSNESEIGRGGKLTEEDSVPFWQRNKSKGESSSAQPRVMASHPPPSHEQQQQQPPLPPMFPAPATTLKDQPGTSPTSQPPLKKRLPKPKTVLNVDDDDSDDDDGYDDDKTMTSNNTLPTANMTVSTAGSSFATEPSNKMPSSSSYFSHPPPPPPPPPTFQQAAPTNRHTMPAPPPPPPTYYQAAPSNRQSMPAPVYPMHPPPPPPPPPAFRPVMPPPPPPAAASIPTPATPGFAPKSVLHSFYGQAPRRKVISQDHYVTWHNQGAPHELKWTSVFVCPLTGEVFPSGRFGDGRYYTVTLADDDGSVTVWYTKKTLAEHGAAARCHDCLLWRDQRSPHAPAPYSLGLDPPYGPDRAMGIPYGAPASTRQEIWALQQKIQHPMLSAGEQADAMHLG